MIHATIGLIDGAQAVTITHSGRLDMDTLSGLDASFLYLETPETPMHIGSFCLYERAPDACGSFHRAVKNHLAQRLHLAPLFTRQLAFMPLSLGHPAWVTAPALDLNAHVRPVKGKTRTVQEAEAICAQLHSQLMDRTRPLWEFHVFERIRRPDGSVCAGIYAKVHHAALDGQGGTELTRAIMDLQAQPRDVPAPQAHRPVPAPTRLSQLREVLTGSFTQYKHLAQALPQAVQALRRTLNTPAADETASGLRAPRMRLAPLTPFNVAVTCHRSFGTVRLPFADCHALAKRVDASFNDLMLWLCSTALRSYLAQHGGLPDRSLLAAMPISLRAPGREALNTQASMTVVALGSHLADPRQRLAAIQASTRKVKTARDDLKGLIPMDYPSLLAPWLVGGVAKTAFSLYRASGLLQRVPMLANLVISNVSGPSQPLYLAGARLLTFHPLSIVVHGTALNITIQTYDGQVDFGLVADPAAVTAMPELTHALYQAFEQAGQQLIAPPPVKTRIKPVAGVTKKSTPRPQNAKATPATPHLRPPARQVRPPRTARTP